MRKIAYYFFLASSLLLTTNGIAQIDDDPDLPKFLNGISKEDYFKARQDYFLQRLGDPSRFSYNPRLQAVEWVRQMEEKQRNNRLLNIMGPSWIQLGPSPIPNGQTTTTSTAVSGRITAIAIHPTNANIVYIGCANGGVYRSMNGGTSWTQIFTGAASFAIGALALAPSSPTTLYVGTGEANSSADSYAGVGLYRIDNADASPTLVGPINPSMTFPTASSSFTTTAFGYRAISKILVHPTDPATIFVSSASGTAGNPNGSTPGTVPPLGLRGVYRSTNATAAAGSVIFTKLTVAQSNCFDSPCTGNATISDMVMEPGVPNNLLVWVNFTPDGVSTTAGGGIYRTTNALAGTPTFTKTLFPTGAGGVRGEFAIASIAGTVTVYAGTGENSTGRLRKSVDGGQTWSITAGTYGFCTGQCFYDIAMAVDPTNADNVYIGGSAGSALYRRSTNGLTSVPGSTNAVGLHADVHVIAVAPSAPATVFFGCDGGMYKSTDAGATWTSLNTAGLHATQFQSIALHPTDLNLTIGGTQDNGTNAMKSDGTFTRLDFGDGGYAAIDQNTSTATTATMYHTYFNDGTLAGYARTTIGQNAFENWAFFGCGGTANGITCPASVLFYAPLVLGPGNPNTVYYGSNVLWRSANQGVTATAGSQTFATAISSISIAAGSGGNADDNYRIVGLNNGDVFATITGNATLTDITPASGAINFPVGRVYISPLNKNVAYVCYTGYFGSSTSHIYKTTNLNDLGGSGVIWAAVGTGLPDVPVNSFTMSNTNANVIFAGTDIGVFISTDAGANWSSYGGGVLPAVPVFDMAMHKVSNVLRIATHGTGFWETSVILPVTFTEFNATVRNKTKVFLEWFTATETNNLGFEIERALVRGSVTDFKWEKIGFVKGSGTTTDPRRYEFEDVPVGGKRFIYRLKQIDFDGNFEYSEQRQVTLNGFDFALFPVSPNPVKQTGIVKYQVPDNGKVSLQLYASNGALVRTVINETKEAGIYQVSFNTTGLSNGTYYVQLKNGDYFDSKPFIIANY